MLERALEDCLTRMRLEGATPEECLAQYPQLRSELAPLLQATQDLGALDSLQPRAEFRAQTRAQLLAHMQANPRRRDSWRSSTAFRYAAGLAVLFVALAASGTALAQKALPGDTLYGWKLASERIWYSLQSSPVDADVYLSGRRISEIQVIRGRANLEEIGIGAYTALLQQLNLDLALDPGKATSVGKLLQEQREQLKEIIENSQADLPELDELFGIVTLPAPAETTPADETQKPDVDLPLIVTAHPLIKKEDEESGTSDEDSNDQESSDGAGDEESSNNQVQEPIASEEPGLLEEVVSGLTGDN